MASPPDPVDPLAATSAERVDPHGMTTPSAPLAAGTPPLARGDDGALDVGTTLAHYRVEKRLGAGGMGAVYLASDLALDRPVALKVLAGEIAADPLSRERFLREARTQARLQHPNVCHIYFVGEEGGRLFFAMEHVDGESLQQRLDREGKIPFGEAAELIRQAALGLREAHRAGFTHRDVKPSNLMLDRRGTVKLVDFGLVKPSDSGGKAAGLTIDRGAVLGTPLYMAPEQARGEAVDHRADIYSLGATLHHLVAGAPPFTAETTIGLISKHLADPRPRLVECRHLLHGAALDRICDRMMAKRPADRFPSYDELLEALEQVAPSTSRPAGFWVRGFALALDMLVLFLLTLPLTLLLRSLHGNVVFAALAPLYAVLCNARWGRTVGKAALEIEIVEVDGGRPPGLARAALRFLVQWGPSFLCGGVSAAAQAHGHRHLGGVLAVLGVVLPIVLGLLAIRVEGKRTLWDRAGGTLVRYRRRG